MRLPIGMKPGRGATEVSLTVHTELPWGTRVAGDEERGHDAAPAAPAGQAPNPG